MTTSKVQFNEIGPIGTKEEYLIIQREKYRWEGGYGVLHDPCLKKLHLKNTVIPEEGIPPMKCVTTYYWTHYGAHYGTPLKYQGPRFSTRVHLRLKSINHTMQSKHNSKEERCKFFLWKLWHKMCLLEVKGVLSPKILIGKIVLNSMGIMPKSIKAL